MSTEDGEEIEFTDNHNETNELSTETEIQISFSDPQAWDDTIILELFNEAINSYNSENKCDKSSKKSNDNLKGKKRKLNEKIVTKEQMATQSLPGQWTTTSKLRPIPSNPTIEMNEHENLNLQTTKAIPIVIEEEMITNAYNEMLQAWYMSGYKAGRYETLKEFQLLQSNK